MQEVKQSINLYLPRFQPAQLSNEVKLLFKAVLSIVFFSLLLVVISAAYRSYYKEEKLVSEQEKLVLSDSLRSAISQIPDRTPDKNLVDRVNKKTKLLKKKQKVIEYLYRDSISEGESFTDLVGQLSEQKVEGVWLSKIEVLNKGKDIQLYGYAKYPDMVSSYLEMLSNKEAYRGRGFKQIEIDKHEQWNKFYISTMVKPEETEIDVMRLAQ